MQKSMNGACSSWPSCACPFSASRARVKARYARARTCSTYLKRARCSVHHSVPHRCNPAGACHRWRERSFGIRFGIKLNFQASRVRHIASSRLRPAEMHYLAFNGSLCIFSSMVWRTSWIRSCIVSKKTRSVIMFRREAGIQASSCIFRVKQSAAFMNGEDSIDCRFESACVTIKRYRFTRQIRESKMIDREASLSRTINLIIHLRTITVMISLNFFTINQTRRWETIR